MFAKLLKTACNKGGKYIFMDAINVKYRIKKNLVLLIIVLWTMPIYAFENIRFLNITPEKIPELAYVLSMHKDNDGYVWFGTYNGLIKYDGTSFRIFDYSEKESSISNSVVHAIAEDNAGNLWIGTENGLNKFNKSSQLFTNYTKRGNDSGSLSSTHIRTIYVENDTTLWLGMRGGGLSRFNTITQQATHFRASAALHDLKSDDVNCLSVLNDSIFYIGTENGGLHIFNKNTHVFNQISDFKGTTISYVHVDTYQNLWVGLWDEGFFFKGLNDTVFRRMDLFDGDKWTPKDIKEDSEGNIWIGAFGKGLIKYNPISHTKQQFLPIEQSDKSLADNRIWSLMIDESQNIWVGSFGSGVSFYDKYSNKFPFVKTNIENPDNNIGSIISAAEGPNGLIWMLTENGLYQYNLNTKVFNLWSPPYGFKESIRRLYFDKSGFLWLGCSGSMVQVNITTLQYRVYDVIKFAPSRKDYIVNYIEQDNKGNIWFSVYEAGLYKIPSNQIGINNKALLDLETYVYYKDSVVIPSNIIWQIKSTPNGNIWITTNSGFCKLNQQRNIFESYSNLAHSNLYSMHPGIIWLGGLGSGLGKFEIATNKLEYYSKVNGLSSDIVFNVTGDYDGNLWLITQSGISKFSPITNTFKNYDASDGIEDVRFSMNSGITLSNGKFMYYSNSGFTIFNPEKIKDNLNTPKVVISDIKLYNRSITYEYADSANKKLTKPLSEINKIEIGHEDKMLTISFNAVFYSSPDQIEYAYQLQGFDKEWNYTNAMQRNATYTNLSTGKYLFKVKASNADGIWSSKTTNLEIEVVPPYWKQWYFKLIVLLVLAFVLIAFVRTQYAKIKKRYAFEEVKKEREIIRLRIDKLDNELEQKNNELISKTLVLLHKNEKIKELKNQVNIVLDKVSKASQPKVYSLLRFIQVEFKNDQYWDQFEHHFNLTHNNFIDRFKEKYPNINHKDLKVCAYVRMDLSNQEIANLLSVTLRGVEASRHRIRKKIRLDRSIALNDFIRNF
ncbi:MAG: triple tyrosine motif-containing protein [Salinivirgaceae bacterium]|nr:triple tyrosine motif-containing protein [Salinivirgaceae bacterium]